MSIFVTNSGSLGEIKTSIATEAQFQALNGSGWILADGRNVAGSAYATFYSTTTVPDFRGLILRGKNNSRADGYQDTAGELTLGNSYGDEIGGHIHQWLDAIDLGGGTGQINRTFDSAGSAVSFATGAAGTATYIPAATSGGNSIFTESYTNATFSQTSETQVNRGIVNFYIKIN